ncbi:MAG: LytTR family transcriptional regulator [Prevotella sp.]|nr:LytTR family transcriptional regulator [Prevotella sp.]
MVKISTEYLFLNSRDELLRIDISQLVYLEAEGNYTNIVTANKLKSVVCMTLGRMQEVLSEKLKNQANNFARVGKKHIINLGYIRSINTVRQKLILSDDHSFAYQLDISKEALKTLKSVLIEIVSKK